jgi:site-specific DNA-methyltransferase (adenine-specific)
MMEPYYQDDAVTLYHGDCLELAEVWAGADVLVTDPPYGVAYADRQGKTVANDHDFAVARSAIDLWGARPMAVFANHASLPRTLARVSEHLDRVRVVTWHKANVNGAAGMGNPWFADVEFAVCGVVTWPKTARSGVISAKRFTGNPAWNSDPEAYLHPTQKPVPLMEALIRAMPPDVIADPFAGSGSTLKAARLLGRRAIGVELEERYCEVIAKRLSQGVLDFGGAA